MAVNSKLMTADELFRLPDDGNRYELVRGELRTMPPGGMEQGAESSIFDLLVGPLRSIAQGSGGSSPTSRASCSPPIRIRSVRPMSHSSAVSGSSRPGYRGGYYRGGAPDIAVEIISPNDLYTEVDEKVAEWLEHGTLVVFVVNPRRKVVAVHRPKQPVDILGIEDTLTAEDVVPGWSLAVRDLFDEP